MTHLEEKPERIRDTLRRLPSGVKAFMAVCMFASATFSTGLVVAVALADQVDAPKVAAEALALARTNRSEITVMKSEIEEFRRFGGCWLIEFGEDRNPSACKYILRNPGEYEPPRPQP